MWNSPDRIQSFPLPVLKIKWDTGQVGVPGKQINGMGA